MGNNTSLPHSKKKIARQQYAAIHNAINEDDEILLLGALFAASLRNDPYSIKTENGMTLMHIAAERGYMGLMETAIRYLNDVDILDDLGRSPLMIAAHNNHGDIVQLLLKLGATGIAGATIYDYIDGKGQTPLMTAVRQQDIEMVRMLLDKNVDIDRTSPTGETALLIATLKHDVTIIRMLVDAGSRAFDVPQEDGLTPFVAAAEINVDVLKLFIQHGGGSSLNNIQTVYANAYQLAIWNPDKSVLKFLLHFDNNSIHVRGPFVKSLILDAASSGSVEALVLIMRAGSLGINTPYLNGTTPLMIAAKLRNIEMVKWLKALGADSDIAISSIHDTPEEDVLKILNEPVDEQFILDVREYVFFHPLINSLLELV